MASGRSDAVNVWSHSYDVWRHGRVQGGWPLVARIPSFTLIDGLTILFTPLSASCNSCTNMQQLEKHSNQRCKGTFVGTL